MFLTSLYCVLTLSFLTSVYSWNYDTLAASCGDPNAEHTDCAWNCGNKCSDWNKVRYCLPWCMPEGCNCKEGYVFDDNINKCVQAQDCTQVCGENEEFSMCANGKKNWARNCSEIKNNQRTEYEELKPETCIQECVCKEDHIRNDNGVCVPQGECEMNEKCTNPHEFWDTCPKTCSSQTCHSIGLSIQCSINPGFCKPSCRCAEGFLRNDAGICIPELECPKKVPGECPENEVWDDCVDDKHFPQKSCASLTLGPVSLKAKKCYAGCKCKEGWLRNDEEACVPPDQCPPNICTGENEIWDHCINNKCLGRLNCSTENFIRGCEKKRDGSCKGGCRCKLDYAYHDNGTCVPKSECAIKPWWLGDIVEYRGKQGMSTKMQN